MPRKTEAAKKWRRFQHNEEAIRILRAARKYYATPKIPNVPKTADECFLLTTRVDLTCKKCGDMRSVVLGKLRTERGGVNAACYKCIKGRPRQARIDKTATLARERGFIVERRDETVRVIDPYYTERDRAYRNKMTMVNLHKRWAMRDDWRLFLYSNGRQFALMYGENRLPNEVFDEKYNDFWDFATKTEYVFPREWVWTPVSYTTYRLTQGVMQYFPAEVRKGEWHIHMDFGGLNSFEPRTWDERLFKYEVAEELLRRTWECVNVWPRKAYVDVLLHRAPKTPNPRNWDYAVNSTREQYIRNKIHEKRSKHLVG